jgi:hypothetical protein
LPDAGALRRACPRGKSGETADLPVSEVLNVDTQTD